MEKLNTEFTISVPLCKNQLELQTIPTSFAVFPTSVSGGGDKKPKQTPHCSDSLTFYNINVEMMF